MPVIVSSTSRRTPQFRCRRSSGWTFQVRRARRLPIRIEVALYVTSFDTAKNPTRISSRLSQNVGEVKHLLRQYINTFLALIATDLFPKQECSPERVNPLCTAVKSTPYRVACKCHGM